jgi:hypothetical protein
MMPNHRRLREAFMMRFIAGAVLALGLVFGVTGPAFAADPVTFQSEQQAQQRCPTDQVVWLNLPTAIYHQKGQRWYGATKNGAYVCRKEADTAGDRPSKNGQ